MHKHRKSVLLNARALEILNACEDSLLKDELLEDTSYLLSLVALNPDALQLMPEEYRCDKDFAMQLVEANALTYRHLSDELKEDPDVLMLAVRNNAEALLCCAPEWRSDLEFLYCLVTLNRHSLQYADLELQSDPELMVVADPLGWLRNDRKFVLRMVEKRGSALRSASWQMQKDPEIVFAAVKRDGLALEFAHADLRSNFQIVKQAVRKNGLALMFADEGLKSNPEIVRHAVNQNWEALSYAHESLLQNKKIIVAGARQNAKALKHAGANVRGDKEVMEYLVQKSGMSLEYASPDLRRHPRIAFLALQDNLESVEFVDDELQNNPAFMKRLQQLLPKKVKDIERAYLEKIEKTNTGESSVSVPGFIRRLKSHEYISPVASELENLKKMKNSPSALKDIKDTFKRHYESQPQQRRSSLIRTPEEAVEEIRRRLSVKMVEQGSIKSVGSFGIGSTQIQAVSSRVEATPSRTKQERAGKETEEAAVAKKSTGRPWSAPVRASRRESINSAPGPKTDPRAKDFHKSLSEQVPAVRQQRDEVYKFVRDQRRSSLLSSQSALVDEVSSTALVPYNHDQKEHQDNVHPQARAEDGGMKNTLPVKEDMAIQPMSSLKKPRSEANATQTKPHVLRFSPSTEEVQNSRQACNDLDNSRGNGAPGHGRAGTVDKTSGGKMSRPSSAMAKLRRVFSDSKGSPQHRAETSTSAPSKSVSTPTIAPSKSVPHERHRDSAVLSQASERPSSAPSKTMSKERSLRPSQAPVQCEACGLFMMPMSKFCGQCGGRANGNDQDGHRRPRIRRPSSAGALCRSGVAPDGELEEQGANLSGTWFYNNGAKNYSLRKVDAHHYKFEEQGKNGLGTGLLSQDGEWYQGQLWYGSQLHGSIRVRLADHLDGSELDGNVISNFRPSNDKVWGEDTIAVSKASSASHGLQARALVPATEAPTAPTTPAKPRASVDRPSSAPAGRNSLRLVPRDSVGYMGPTESDRYGVAEFG